MTWDYITKGEAERTGVMECWSSGVLGGEEWNNWSNGVVEYWRNRIQETIYMKKRILKSEARIQNKTLKLYTCS